MKEKLKDILSRAAWTFVQAFLATLTIDAASLTSGTNFWRSAIISALAAGLSAVKTAALNIISEKEKL